MAGKISDLTEKLTAGSTDLLEMVSGGVNYKIQKSNLVTGLATTDITGVTASAAELNVLDGVPATLTATELGYVDGVTSAIQSQLDGKQAVVSGVSDTEIGYLDGVTSSIQTQLTAKAAKGANTDITSLGGLTTPLSVAQGGSGAATLTGIVKGNGTSAMTAVTAPSGTIVGTTDTQTLTNKRITKRIVSTASSATPTPDCDITDVYQVTALAAGAIFGAPTGTPTDGQTLIIRIKDNASAQTLAFNAIYRFSTDLPAPTTTVISKTMYLGFIYNSTDTKWDCLAKLDNI